MKWKIMKAKASRLLHSITLLGGVTESRAEAVSTKLREAGYLPKGGRGPHAPVLSSIQSAAYLLALAGAQRVDDVPKLMVDLQTMVDDQGRFIVPVVASIIASMESAYQVKRILLQPRIPMAEVEFRNGDACRFFHAAQWAERGFDQQQFIAAQGQAFLGQIGHIGGALLHQFTKRVHGKVEIKA
jgi:hypothetical protein